MRRRRRGYDVAPARAGSLLEPDAGQDLRPDLVAAVPVRPFDMQRLESGRFEQAEAEDGESAFLPGAQNGVQILLRWVRRALHQSNAVEPVVE